MNRIRTKFIQGFFLLLIQALAYTACCFSMNELLDDADPQEGVSVKAPMPGQVIKTFATLGQMVKRGDILCLIETMKMQLTIRSEGEGKVTHIAQGNDYVNQGVVLVSMLPNFPGWGPIPPEINTPPDNLNPPPLFHLEETNITEDEKAQNDPQEEADVLQGPQASTLKAKPILLLPSTFLEKGIVKKKDFPSLQIIPFLSTANSISGPHTPPREVKSGKAMNNPAAKVILSENSGEKISSILTDSENILPVKNAFFSSLKIAPFLKTKNQVYEELSGQPGFSLLRWNQWLGGLMILLTFSLTYLIRDRRLKRIQLHALQRQSCYLPIIKYLPAVDFNKHPYTRYQTAYNINLPPKYSMKAA